VARCTEVEVFLAMGYMVNLLPFIGIRRPMFLYHYLTALLFSIMIAGVMLGRIRRGRPAVFMALTTLTLASFFVVAPVTFGTNLPGWWPWWGP
jgi:dolichyl-phosphate-mannose-protein mannosyltransferase